MNPEIDISNVILKTERLLIRPWRQSDIDDFYSYASVDGVGQMAGWKPHESKEESKIILDMFISHKKTFALEYQGKVIGSVGIEKYNETHFPEFEKAKGKDYVKNWVALIGDSTFLHTGVNSLMNMVYNKATGTVIILDNSTTGMTGHQDHAATGKTLQGELTYAINIYHLCKAMGIEHVYEIDAFDIEGLEKLLKQETQRDALSVIITKSPCEGQVHSP